MTVHIFQTRHAFSLIELAVVLVIIGLIVGGVLVGKDMMRSAELNSVITDLKKFRTAIDTFNYKYDGLPGDIDNASSYWPTCDTPATNCDGDSDGLVEFTGAEHVRAWQMLSLSEILPGNYTGSPSVMYIAGQNVPESRLRNCLYMYRASGTVGGNFNGFSIGKQGGTQLNTGCMTPVEAHTLDKKLDDGLFGSGLFLGVNSGGCVDGSWEYDLSNDETPGCAARYMDDE